MHEGSCASPNWSIKVVRPTLDRHLVETRVDQSQDAAANLYPTIPANVRCRMEEEIDATHLRPGAAHRRDLAPGRMAAVLLVFCVAGLIGWIATEMIQVWRLDKSAQEALAEYVVGAAGGAHVPTLSGAANSGEPTTWPSSHPSTVRWGVDLSTSGFQLRSVANAPTPDMPAKVLVYVNAGGEALAMTVRPDPGNDHADITGEVRRSIAAFTWVDNGISYKLVSDMPASVLFMIAIQAQKQTCHRQTGAYQPAFREIFGRTLRRIVDCEPVLRVVGKL